MNKQRILIKLDEIYSDLIKLGISKDYNQEACFEFRVLSDTIYNARVSVEKLLGGNKK